MISAAKIGITVGTTGIVISILAAILGFLIAPIILKDQIKKVYKFNLVLIAL